MVPSATVSRGLDQSATQHHFVTNELASALAIGVEAANNPSQVDHNLRPAFDEEPLGGPGASEVLFALE